MKLLQKIGWGLGLLMLTERLWKQQMVKRFFRQPLPAAQTRTGLVSIIQPVLSGDPTMPACLESSLRLKSSSQLEFIWLVDRDDEEGQRLCQALRARYPEQEIQLVIVSPPPEDCNPKTFKLIAGREVARGDVLCVLDDDTMLPENGLDIALPFLDRPGVGLAFGLPYYVNFSNIWSSMVSVFVNGNSLLSYIPYTTLTEPFTINGMLLLSLILRPSWAKLCYTLLYFGGNQAIVHQLNESYLRQATPDRRFWLIPIMLVLIPVQMLIALFSPQHVNWRGNVVRIERDGNFVYMRRREGSY